MRLKVCLVRNLSTIFACFLQSLASMISLVVVDLYQEVYWVVLVHLLEVPPRSHL